MSKPSVLKPRGKPRGRPFTIGPGGDLRRNTGGKPFVKIHQRLSVIAADQLSSTADSDLCALVGAPTGSTNGFCVVRAMILEAVVAKNVSAANFLFQCTEAAKVRVDLNEKKDVTLRMVSVDAQQVIDKLLPEQIQREALAGQVANAVYVNHSRKPS